jgi:transcriptional regulator with XRE-family HTH domain
MKNPEILDNRSVHRQDRGMRITHREMFRAAIDRAGLSYRGLADRAGCSLSFISALANGRKTGVTPELAERISEALAIPVDLVFAPTESGESGSPIRPSRTAA